MNLLTTDIVILLIGVPLILFLVINQNSILYRYNPFLPKSKLSKRTRLILLFIGFISSLAKLVFTILKHFGYRF